MSEFYKPFNGKKQLQEMLNDTPTPETDKIWDDLCDSWCNWSVDFAHEKLLDKSRKLEHERNKLATALERILEYQGRFAEEDPESIAKEALQSLKQSHHEK